jgi:hypothetical protein
VPRIKTDAADHEVIAVVQDCVFVLAALEPVGLPVRAAVAGGVDHEAALGQLTCAGKKVGVDVGFGGGHELQALRGSDALVLIDVAHGIDDDGFAGGLATNQVGILRQLAVIDLSKEHVATSFCGHRAAFNVS